ncbi:MAG: hypothetical protein ACE5D4_04750, partial [Thermodesulfobacteriota bacterium]
VCPYRAINKPPAMPVVMTFFLSMMDFDDNQGLHEHALYRFQLDSKWRKEIVLKVNDGICHNVGGESLHKLPASQYQKKVYLRSMCQALHSVFHKTSNHQ